MSKSRGNVANPFEAMELWSTDAIRMYLMTKGGNSASDADYSEAEIERFYKKELAGQMGNLLARVTGKKLVKKLAGRVERLWTMPEKFEEEDKELVGLLKELPGELTFLSFCPFFLTDLIEFVRYFRFPPFNIRDPPFPLPPL